ncbi:MAG: restriction endonuclease subunit S [Anaerolineales bacterium]
MEVKAGYKQTEVGIIPKDWGIRKVAEMATTVASGRSHVNSEFGDYPVYGSTGVIGTCTDAEYFGKSILIARVGANAGKISIVDGKYGVTDNTIIIKIDTSCHWDYFWRQLEAKRLNSMVFGSGQPLITGTQIKGLDIPCPPTLAEQEAIAEALTDADAFIEALEQLLAKKRQVQQGAMQGLLMGKRRLPGFGGEWKEKKIEEIAFPSSEKNDAKENLPVLTCSKHLGFVNSLSFFKNQVFSNDTSGYKIIRRGQIGYPANHVEEGSIGLQDLYDVAIVSPIYVVFSVTEEVNSYFLHRLLKLDAYRQKFATETTSSVDRRGSLRWHAFSQITVNLPGIEEQTAIAEILSDMDAEITALEGKLSKAREVKAGMMSELLTGRIRLVGNSGK